MSVERLEERRQTVRNKFHTLLETRTETLALFSALVGMRPFKPETEVQLVLQEFCESLVDYSASAHFQLYSYIESDSEQRVTVRELSEQDYPRIAEITRLILRFSEKYDCESGCDDLSELDPDLAELGEALAERIQFEDKIIQAMSTR
ncbi:Rsd/AlgQ family anti-sigma factor [Thiohalophilus thiocyanatoxydans]|uniref:Regulator of sigma D n=1 Tax=Thiohalophilus thiocyanatoxydans TaxID=381308 RepID=A0A4R8IJT6_9GAMM|nr:Rsd/AlgQ family anti-sigma factor [Thiohalophilus thiocyanatoxydans]TDY00991.1 regulator of sigma D [Thiohalophilus thiocyanatoxydans]